MSYQRFIGRIACSDVETPATRGLKEYFIAKGLEVIDNRAKGGALWVVGTKAQIGSIVREACGMFCAGGTYMDIGGKAVSRRPAWFTHCAR